MPYRIVVDCLLPTQDYAPDSYRDGVILGNPT